MFLPDWLSARLQADGFEIQNVLEPLYVAHSTTHELAFERVQAYLIEPNALTEPQEVELRELLRSYLPESLTPPLPAFTLVEGSHSTKERSNPLHRMAALLDTKKLSQKYKMYPVEKTENQAPYFLFTLPIYLLQNPLVSANFTLLSRHLRIDKKYREGFTGLSPAHYTERFRDLVTKEGLTLHVHFNQAGEIINGVLITASTTKNVSKESLKIIETRIEPVKALLEEIILANVKVYQALDAQIHVLEKSLEGCSAGFGKSTTPKDYQVLAENYAQKLITLQEHSFSNDNRLAFIKKILSTLQADAPVNSIKIKGKGEDDETDSVAERLPSTPTQKASSESTQIKSEGFTNQIRDILVKFEMLFKQNSQSKNLSQFSTQTKALLSHYPLKEALDSIRLHNKIHPTVIKKLHKNGNLLSQIEKIYSLEGIEDRLIFALENYDIKTVKLILDCPLSDKMDFIDLIVDFLTQNAKKKLGEDEKKVLNILDSLKGKRPDQYWAAISLLKASYMKANNLIEGISIRINLIIALLESENFQLAEKLAPEIGIHKAILMGDRYISAYLFYGMFILPAQTQQTINPKVFPCLLKLGAKDDNDEEPEKFEDDTLRGASGEALRAEAGEIRQTLPHIKNTLAYQKFTFDRSTLVTIIGSYAYPEYFNKNGVIVVKHIAENASLESLIASLGVLMTSRVLIADFTINKIAPGSILKKEVIFYSMEKDKVLAEKKGTFNLFKAPKNEEVPELLFRIHCHQVNTSMYSPELSEMIKHLIDEMHRRLKNLSRENRENTLRALQVSFQKASTTHHTCSLQQKKMAACFAELITLSLIREPDIHSISAIMQCYTTLVKNAFEVQEGYILSPSEQYHQYRQTWQTVYETATDCSIDPIFLSTLDAVYRETKQMLDSYSDRAEIEVESLFTRQKPYFASGRPDSDEGADSDLRQTVIDMIGECMQIHINAGSEPVNEAELIAVYPQVTPQPISIELLKSELEYFLTHYDSKWVSDFLKENAIKLAAKKGTRMLA